MNFNKLTKRCKRVKYDIELLLKIAERDNCLLINKENNENLQCKTKINFICSCLEFYKKSFVSMFISGAFCRECTIKKGNRLRIDSIMKIYCKDISYLQYRQNVRKKTMKTNILKYGFPNYSQYLKFCSDILRYQNMLDNNDVIINY